MHALIEKRAYTAASNPLIFSAGHAPATCGAFCASSHLHPQGVGSLQHFCTTEMHGQGCCACRYLGAKLRYGHQPLYTSGLDEEAKRFGSLHAAQRHMIDSNKCTMCYDGNEDEYDDYYDYPCVSPSRSGELCVYIFSTAGTVRRRLTY